MKGDVAAEPPPEDGDMLVHPANQLAAMYGGAFGKHQMPTAGIDAHLLGQGQGLRGDNPNPQSAQTFGKIAFAGMKALLRGKPRAGDKGDPVRGDVRKLVAGARFQKMQVFGRRGGAIQMLGLRGDVQFAKHCRLMQEAHLGQRQV
jgi:hypothetical protein